MASTVLGLEVAGRVAAVGEGVEGWRLGDRVCALTPGGGYADYCVAPAGHCLPVPQGWSLRDAAGLLQPINLELAVSEGEVYAVSDAVTIDRVRLAALTGRTLKQGLELLGLETLERM